MGNTPTSIITITVMVTMSTINMMTMVMLTVMKLARPAVMKADV